MQITLVIPPSPFLLDDRAFPFLGPLQIGAVARDLGHSVKVADLTGYKQRHPGEIHADLFSVMEEAKGILQKEVEDADIVGFYALAAQYPQVVELKNFVREHNEKCVTVLGGPHANTSSSSCVSDGFDYVIVSDQGGGGGELGFIQLLEALSSGRTLDPVVKVPSREAGVVYQNDRWPLPARDLIDLESYHYLVGGERAASIVSSTGCPFACVFCSHWEGYRKLEMKSPKKVREEIRQIRERYGWRAFMFYDDEVNLRPDFLEEFLPMLKSEDVIWRAFFKNGKRLTEDSVFQQMAEAGCVQICTGAESAEPKILKDIRKGAFLENNTDFVRFSVKNGIRPKVFTQVGLPGETPESVKALRNWLVQMAGEGLDDADVTITTPYEGTPIFEKPELFKIGFNKNDLNFSKKTVLYKGVPGEYKSHVWHDGLSSEELVVARQWVEDEFRKAAGLQPLIAKDDG